MPWTRLDDGFCTHPKVIPLSHLAFRLYVSALNWSVARSTDGEIPAIALALALPTETPRNRRKAAAELEAAELWHAQGDGWLIHDFADYQETRDEIDARREKWASRQQNMRVFYRSGIAAQVRERDGDLCRYCGKVVNWNDRRSGDGGTYDHIVPGGETSYENMVVACRRCNSKKGPRTPEQSGVELIPIQVRPSSDLEQKPRSVSASHPNPPPTQPKVDKSTNHLDPNRGLTLAIEEASKDPTVKNPRKVGRYRFEQDPVRYNAKVDLEHTDLTGLAVFKEMP